MRRPRSVQSDLLLSAGFRHAFFERHHGWSTGAFSSLNFSASVGDEAESVRGNLRLAAEVLGVSPERVCFAEQVHGREVAVVLPGQGGRDAVDVAADAVVSMVPGVACAVRTADCVPILIGDAETGAVCAIHAGWRGVEAKVVGAALARLRALIGGSGVLIAAIGPYVGLEVFEVSTEVAERLRLASPEPNVVEHQAGKPHVDLGRIVRAQLLDLGVAPERIEQVGGCTASDPERWFSYRRDGARSGRHLHAIVVRS